ncbi:hypothetical protein ABQE93_24355 [Mycolicibacterium sp. XJ662]
MRAALELALIGIRSRRVNGLPEGDMHRELAEALAKAMTVDGHSDVREPIEDHAVVMPTVPLDQAATRLVLSPRQTRRLAPKLGGKKIGGRWFLDEEAINEHLQGHAS